MLEKLIHALRTDLTVINFELSQSEREETLLSIAKLLARLELLLKCDRNALDQKTCKLDSVVESLLDELSNENRERIDYSPSELTVTGDEVALRSLIDEMIGNSLAFSEGKIYLSLHNTGGHGVIRLEDFGEGIPESIQARIAEPFSKSTHPHGGHGLGFALIWSIVQAHQGALTLITGDKQGTTLLCSLDLV